MNITSNIIKQYLLTWSVKRFLKGSLGNTPRPWSLRRRLHTHGLDALIPNLTRWEATALFLTTTLLTLDIYRVVVDENAVTEILLRERVNRLLDCLQWRTVLRRWFNRSPFFKATVHKKKTIHHFNSKYYSQPFTHSQLYAKRFKRAKCK